MEMDNRIFLCVHDLPKNKKQWLETIQSPL